MNRKDFAAKLYEKYYANERNMTPNKKTIKRKVIKAAKGAQNERQH